MHDLPLKESEASQSLSKTMQS